MHVHDRLALAGLLAAVVVFLGPALAGDRALMTFDVGRWAPWSTAIGPDLEAPSFNADAARFVLPRAETLRRALAEGALPLWDSSTFVGSPFLALWQTHVLYPPDWLLLGVDARRVTGFSIALHLLVAAAGCFALLRSLGLVAGAAFAGALAFAFGGGTMLRMSHPSFVATLAWLPFALLSAERFLAEGRRRWLLGLAAAFALLILAGQATLVVIAGYFLGAWCLVRGARAGRREATALLGALLAGAFLAAPQLLPSFELSRRSARAERELDALRSTRLAPAHLAQLVAPELYGAVRHPQAERLRPPLRPEDRGPSFAAAVAGYAGAWMPAFAVLALLAGGWGGRSLALALLAAVSLALALGSPLFSLAHALLPGFRFSTINRALPFVGFALALLGARGLHVASRGELPRARVWGVAGAWLLGSVALWAWLRLVSLPAADGTPRALAHALSAADRFLLFAVAGGIAMALAPLATRARGPAARRTWWGAVLLLLVVELFGFAWPYRVLRPLERVLPETASLSWLRENGEGRRVVRHLPEGRADDGFVQGSALSFFGIREVGGFAPLHAESLDRYLSEAGWQRQTPWSVGASSRPGTFGSPLFGLLAAPLVLAPPGVRVPGAEKLFEADLAIWRAPGALPEAFVVGETVSVAGLDDALAQLTHPGFDPRAMATVEAPAMAHSSGAPGRAAIRGRAPGRITVEVEGAAPGWLFLSEAWAPGWKVRRDGGAAIPAVPTNGIFLGVAVPAGRHELVFAYRPASFAWGLGLALAGVALLGGLVRFGPRRTPP